MRSPRRWTENVGPPTPDLNVGSRVEEGQPLDRVDARPRARGDADEQRLHRELRRQVELLQHAPRVPHLLGRALRAEQPLARRVLAQQRQLVEVDRRLVGADGDRDEIAVPRGELLDLREQLLALGAARRALHLLLGVARRQLELRRCAPPPAHAPRRRVACAFASSAAAASPGVERRVAIHRARLLDQQLAALGRLRIEQPLEPVEPAGGDARERARARRRRARGARASTRSRIARSDSRENGTSWQRERIVSGSGRGRRRPGRSPRTAAAPRDPSAARRRRPRRAGARGRRDRRAGRPRTAACAGRAAARGSRRCGSSRRAPRARRGRGGTRARSAAAHGANVRATSRLPTPAGRGRGTRAPGPRAAPRRAAAQLRSGQRSAANVLTDLLASSLGFASPSSATMRSGSARGERAIGGVDRAHEAAARALDPVAAPPERARRSSGSSSTRNVRSGRSPPVTVRLSSRTRSLAEPARDRPGRRPTSRGSGRRRRARRARAPAGSPARRARRAPRRRAPPRSRPSSRRRGARACAPPRRPASRPARASRARRGPAREPLGEEVRLRALPRAVDSFKRHEHRARLRYGSMRAVVTGGAGFIGSNLVDALIARGDDVVGRRRLLDPASART